LNIPRSFRMLTVIIRKTTVSSVAIYLLIKVETFFTTEKIAIESIPLQPLNEKMEE
jgi:hypothetical protein